MEDNNIFYQFLDVALKISKKLFLLFLTVLLVEGVFSWRYLTKKRCSMDYFS